MFSRILAAEAMGDVLELDNQLHEAAESYRRALELAGEHPLPNAEEVHLGLARIHYQWNDLDAAERHGQQSRQLAGLYDRAIDRSVVSDIFLARVALARGDVEGAAAMLAQAHRVAQEMNFALRLPEIAAAQVVTLIRQGQVAAAAQVAGQYELPLSTARVLLAQGDPSGAIAVLEPFGRQMEARGWADERLKTMVLLALAQHALGADDEAAQSLDEALALAAPGGFIRLFVDEGPPMAELLSAAAARSARPEYVARLLAAFAAESAAESPASSSARRLLRPQTRCSAPANSKSCGWSPKAFRTRRSASGSSWPSIRSRATTAASSRSCTCSGAPKPSPAPGSWGCSRRLPGSSLPRVPLRAPRQHSRTTLRPTPWCLPASCRRG